MIIGLTGQTGAGKSTVCEFLREKGLFIVDCDKVARNVTEKGSKTLDLLAEAFGGDIILSDGTLNRKELASRAFQSAEKTALLNSITHPEIINAINNVIKEHKNENIILDAPTLIESGAYKLCDKIVSVLADANIRKERIIARDDISYAEAEKRMSAQKDDSFYKEYSDAVIFNDGDKLEVRKSAESIFSKIGVL